MTIPNLHLDVLPERLCIHRLPPDTAVPAAVFERTFYALVRSTSELSIVCEADVSIESSAVAADWRGLRVRGPLDLALTGILAHLSRILADAGIPLFAVSTYDTDYVLVPAAELAAATDAFETNGITIAGP